MTLSLTKKMWINVALIHTNINRQHQPPHQLPPPTITNLHRHVSPDWSLPPDSTSARSAPRAPHRSRPARPAPRRRRRGARPPAGDPRCRAAAWPGGTMGTPWSTAVNVN